MDQGGVSRGHASATFFHNQYDKYSVHKSAAITEKGREPPNSQTLLGFQYCSLLSAMMC